MVKEFTINIYNSLINTLFSKQYVFKSFKDFLKAQNENSIILRHDVERLPHNSLVFAQIQSKLNIKGTYYFRTLPQSFDPSIIKEISSLGHEIGYHYETMDTCKGDINKAYDEFCRNLEKFRKLVSVSTICMHGSPMSKYDNKKIWEKYDYHKLDIIGEPYFDIDFNEVLYLTDTGRRWDGKRFSVRDKIDGSRKMEVGRQKSEVGRQKSEVRSRKSEVNNQQSATTKRQEFHSTNEIIKAAEKGTLPKKIMFTFHPQRWTDKSLPWLKELLWQNLKNQVKRVL